ncbi:PQQ-binding-like beta-propeller repeat protein [Alienimonas sp. DA493]|uniref:outer membrane protein assembly factor BamB family protein n=1 Tax=Alienimonas sp. DA493 TaxID=3373605 RepID=UPI0037546C0C
MSCALLIVAAVAVAAAGDLNLTPGPWPMFRGVNGVGVGPDPLPADLIRPENLRWSVEVPGRGWGSPVVAEGPDGGLSVYLPTADEDGATQSVLAYDLRTGRVRWNRLLFVNENPDFTHPTNTYASCTPVATKDVVFVHFGKYGTAALDARNGHTLWERRDFECDHFRGPASSPLLVQLDGLSPRLIVPFDGVGEDDQYVVALDAATGETLWRYERDPSIDEEVPDLRKAYGTPALLNVGGETVVVTTGSRATVGLDPATGERVWRVVHGGMNTGSVPQGLPQPILDLGDAVVVTTGDGPSSVVRFAAKLRQTDVRTTDAAAEPQVDWSSNRAAPKRTTPLALDPAHLFTVDDEGVAALLSAEGGEVLDRVRLGDSYWASPVRAGGTIFTFGKEGTAAALTATENGELVVADTQTLDEGVWATPALVGGGLVLRTEHTLRFYHPKGTNE